MKDCILLAACEAHESLPQHASLSVDVFTSYLTMPIKAALAHGMGPRGSTLICGYTSYHGLLESCLADLKKKEMIFGMEL
ncbi:hypothetical protein ACSBR1_014426 [Camellia fascicularis]